MGEAKPYIFFLASLGLSYFSRASLLRPRTHGFYRFFAWEAILALALLNADVWFHEPFSWHQLISWCLLVISSLLVLHGLHLLAMRGQQDAHRADPALLDFEKTTALVTVGAYHYIRHPLYSSLLFLGWGVFFKAPSWIGAALALWISLCLFVAARIEERENVRFFGEAYEAYRRRTKMFVPYLF
jgi:protein-S-isoprenylcysteine O-methyltransferase Ste14